MAFFFNKKEKAKKEEMKWVQLHEQSEVEIMSLYQKWKEEKEIYWKNIDGKERTKTEIDNALTASRKPTNASKMGLFINDCTAFDSVSELARKSDYAKKVILEQVYKEYTESVNAFLDTLSPGIGFIMSAMQPLVGFPECTDLIRHSNKHLDYFTTDKYLRSVLTEHDDIERGLKEILNYEVNNGLNYINNLSIIKEYAENGRYQEAYNALTGADYDVSVLEQAKYALIRSALNLHDSVEDERAQSLYEKTRSNVDKRFSIVDITVSEKIDEKTYKPMKYITQRVYVIPDIIIADTIVNFRSGNMKMTNYQLQSLMESNLLEKDQYYTLQRFFKYIGAYEQEIIVLESMITNQIPRTAELEKRLQFLKNNIGLLTKLKDNPVFDSELSRTKVLIYDYRFFQWSESQINDYFLALSAKGQIARGLLVASEWSKNINVNSSIKWDTNKLRDRLDSAIRDEISDNLSCCVIKASVLGTEKSDIDNVIYITEGEGLGNYQWIAFIVSAYQMTKKIVSVSVLTAYCPEMDLLLNGDDFEKNNHSKQRYLSLKNNQNPKAKNYTFTMQSLIIEETEKYMNSELAEDSIY